MTYNKEMHKQLVKNCLDAQSQGKSLFTENSKEFFALNEYDQAVSEQVFWTYRVEFIKTIKKFLTKNIDFDEFEGTFSSIY